jgi:FkbM family methyltransferase
MISIAKLLNKLKSKVKAKTKSPKQLKATLLLERPSLNRLLSQADFKLVDIGARGGAMAQLKLLAPFSHYYACEPDKEEAQKLETEIQESSPWQGVTVFQEALSSKEEEATLHITKQPGLSSLLEPNYEVINRYYRTDEWQVEATVSVPTISLDRAAARYGFEDACFLKLDTQGTELDILRSGEKLLQESVLGIYIEVEFHSLYKDQPLFAEVDTYLRNLGFSLFDLHRGLLRRKSYQDELYSRRTCIFAHTLYLKEPDPLPDINREMKLKRLARLLGLALAFEHYDLALELISSQPLEILDPKIATNEVIKELEELIRYQTTYILKSNLGQRESNPMSFDYRDRLLKNKYR